MLKKGLRDLLLADTDISTLVGPVVRIGRLPEGTSYPAIVFHVIHPEYSVGLQGVNATQARMVQFDCWAKSPKGVDDLAQALHNLLNNYRGVLSEGTTILSSTPCGDVDSEDEQLKLSGIQVDFKFWFTPGEFIAGVEVIEDGIYWQEF